MQVTREVASKPAKRFSITIKSMQAKQQMAHYYSFETGK